MCEYKCELPIIEDHCGQISVRYGKSIAYYFTFTLSRETLRFRPDGEDFSGEECRKLEIFLLL